MPSHAEILVSLIDELKRIDRRIEALIVANEARVLATRWHLIDAAAQMAKVSGDADRPLRDNRSFLPGPPLSPLS